MPELGDRLPYGFFEADDEGYMCTPDDGDVEGHAPGISFAIYIDPPDKQLETYYPASLPDWDGFKFTDDELEAWPQWMQKQFPHAEIVSDGAEVLTLEYYGEYRDDEDTDALMMRITVNNNEYNKLRNRWTIFYHGLMDYIVHCRNNREES